MSSPQKLSKYRKDKLFYSQKKMSVDKDTKDEFYQPKPCCSKPISHPQIGPSQFACVVNEIPEANDFPVLDYSSVTAENLDLEYTPNSTGKLDKDHNILENIIPADPAARLKSKPRIIRGMVSRITNALDKYKSGKTQAILGSLAFDPTLKSKSEKAENENIESEQYVGSSSFQVAKLTNEHSQTRKVAFDSTLNSVQLLALANKEIENETELIEPDKNDLQNSNLNTFDFNPREPEELLCLFGETFKLPTDIGESDEIELDSENLLKQLVDSSSEKEINENIGYIQQIIAMYMNENDPSSSKALSNALSEEILEKLKTATNREDILRILMRVMGKAYHCIFAHLQLVSTHNEMAEKKLYEQPKPILDLGIKPEELPSEINVLSPEKSSATAPSNQFLVQVYKDTGLLSQKLCFENKEFTLEYRILKNNKVAEIAAAACTQNLSVSKNIPQLYEMQTKSISYIHQQLGKYVHDVNTVNKAMIELISEFQVGKYLLIGDPYTKKINKSMKNKIKEMNVYSGIIYQIANGLSAAMTKFRSGILKAMESCSNQEGMLPTLIRSQLIGIFPIKGAVPEVQKGLIDIDSTLKMGQDSLKSFKATKEIPIKEKHVKIIKNFLEAIRRLQFGTNSNMDFGVVMMAIVTNTSTLVNLSREEDTITKVDAGEQNEMYLSLMKLCRNFSHFIKYTSKLESFSSYNATKTMEGIRRFSITKNGKNFKALYSWRYVFAIPEQDFPYKPLKPPVNISQGQAQDTKKAKENKNMEFEKPAFVEPPSLA